MRRLIFTLLALLAVARPAQADWPTDARLSGNAFLTPGLQAQQADPDSNPITLWRERGQALWDDASGGKSCASCHGPLSTMKQRVPVYPRQTADLVHILNLEDQIIACRQRSGWPGATAEDDSVLALSAALHQVAAGEPIAPQPLPGGEAQWQAQLDAGARLFNTRFGRINLSCANCHQQSIGRQMRGDVISPANPTGFPIYRLSWQGLGSIERRLRACFFGVQAQVPPPGDPRLRQLELYLTVRARGLALDGPSLRR